MNQRRPEVAKFRTADWLAPAQLGIEPEIRLSVD